jgi:hypothetical protein
VNTAPWQVSQITQGSPAYFGEAINKALTKNYPSRLEASQSVSNFFQNAPVPSSSSLFWNPSSPPSASKLKMIQHGMGGIADNFHKHGFYDDHVNELENRLPRLASENMEFNVLDQFEDYESLIGELASNIGGVSYFNSPYGITANQIQRINNFSSNNYYEYMRP